jgi:hypothetical protein
MTCKESSPHLRAYLTIVGIFENPNDHDIVCIGALFFKAVDIFHITSCILLDSYVASGQLTSGMIKM